MAFHARTLWIQWIPYVSTQTQTRHIVSISVGSTYGLFRPRLTQNWGIAVAANNHVLGVLGQRFAQASRKQGEHEMHGEWENGNKADGEWERAWVEERKRRRENKIDKPALLFGFCLLKIYVREISKHWTCGVVVRLIQMRLWGLFEDYTFFF